MDIKIKVTDKYGRLTQREPFLLAENDRPIISIEAERNITVADIVFEMGNEKKVIRCFNLNKGVELPTVFARLGTLNITIAQIAQGRAVKEIVVEPIIFTETQGSIEGRAWFEEIGQKLLFFETQLNNQNEKLTETDNRVLLLEEKVAEQEKEITRLAEYADDLINA